MSLASAASRIAANASRAFCSAWSIILRPIVEPPSAIFWPDSFIASPARLAGSTTRSWNAPCAFCAPSRSASAPDLAALAARSAPAFAWLAA